MIPISISYLTIIVPWQTVVLTTLNLFSTLGLIILAYYASRIFIHMRLGRLETGWKLIAQGIILMSSGFLFVTIEHVVSRESMLYFYLDSIGASLSLVGIILMLIGLHSHYVVWDRKNITSKPRESRNETA